MIPSRGASDGEKLPAVLWLGKADGRWPVEAFTDENQAKVWQAADVGDTRRIWEISTSDAVEKRVVVVPTTYTWEGPA